MRVRIYSRGDDGSTSQEVEPTGPDPELISTIEKGIGFGEDYKKPKEG